MTAGYFERERDRLRAELRAKHPTAAELVDQARAAHVSIERIHAVNDACETWGDPGDFERRWQAAADTSMRDALAVAHRMSQRDVPRGT